MTISKTIFNLSKFKIDNSEIGHDKAEKIIKDWLDNFKIFDLNIHILQRLLENIDFIFDTEIVESCQNFISNNLSKNYDFIITSFGLENESSARITKSISNSKYKIELDIHKALDHNKTLLFIDNFLISGGQFISIIKSFLSQIEDRKALNLNYKEIEIFKKIDKIFLFNTGTEVGRIRANNFLKENDINGKLFILEQFNINKTLFGKIGNLIKLENNEHLTEDDINSSIFYGFPSSDIKKLYDILKDVGIKLLKNNKKHWLAERINNSFLGYGNSGGLIIGECNVPTFTVCSMWMGGEIQINNKNISWKPLIKRKEKIIKNSEHFYNMFLKS